jgi:3-deoxy-D-manno-octulosonate 8-phosphate phosphatase (KDO 8-P phosphatase)
MVNYKEKLQNIDTFIFDYDGVLTDNTVLISSDGQMLRTANVRDGYVLQLAKKLGYRIIIISGGTFEGVKQRFKGLKIDEVYLGVSDKFKFFNEYISKHNIDPVNILYMGDDIPDIESMRSVGVATCPADAVEEVKAVSHYISAYDGGKCCVRDVIEQVLKLHGKWMSGDAFKW